jgi:hypothetical protein
LDFIYLIAAVKQVKSVTLVIQRLIVHLGTATSQRLTAFGSVADVLCGTQAANHVQPAAKYKGPKAATYYTAKTSTLQPFLNNFF